MGPYKTQHFSIWNDQLQVAPSNNTVVILIYQQCNSKIQILDGHKESNPQRIAHKKNQFHF